MDSENDIFYDDEPAASSLQGCKYPFMLREPDSMERLVHKLPMSNDGKITLALYLERQPNFDNLNISKISKKTQEQFAPYEWQQSQQQRNEDIFHSDESNHSINIPTMIVPTEQVSRDLERRSGSERQHLSNSENRGRSKDPATKNFLQFLMKVFKRFIHIYLNEQGSEQARKAWEELNKEGKIKHSLKGFSQLFRCKPLRRCWRRMFQCRYLRREIFGSGISAQLKVTYLQKQTVMRKGFKVGRIDYLN